MINFLYVVFPVVCLSVGFYFGFNIGKTSEMPKATEKIKHPIIKEEKEQEKAIEELSKELKNLDNYDGTSTSQEDI